MHAAAYSAARMLAAAAVAASARAEVRAAPVGVFCSLRTYLTEDRLRNCSLSFAAYGTGQHLTASRCSASRERCTPRAAQDVLPSNSHVIFVESVCAQPGCPPRQCQSVGQGEGCRVPSF